MGWDGQSSVEEDEMKQDRRALQMALMIPIIAMKVMIARLWYFESREMVESGLSQGLNSVERQNRSDDNVISI
jgi:hypothetical protein